MRHTNQRVQIIRTDDERPPERLLASQIWITAPGRVRFTDDEIEATLLIEVANDGEPYCAEYTVRRAPGAKDPAVELVTTEVARGLRLRLLMSRALLALLPHTVIKRRVARPDGTYVADVDVNQAYPAWQVDALDVASSRRTKRTATDEAIREFAEQWKAHYVPGRIDEFAESQNMTSRTAWRWRRKAEDAGYLDTGKGANNGQH